MTGNRVTEVAIAVSGISMLPTPIDWRNWTGMISSDSIPTATVSPLRTTARPAWALAATIASSEASPASRSSRQRVTISSE